MMIRRGITILLALVLGILVASSALADGGGMGTMNYCPPGYNQEWCNL